MHFTHVVFVLLSPPHDRPDIFCISAHVSQFGWQEVLLALAILIGLHRIQCDQMLNCNLTVCFTFPFLLMFCDGSVSFKCGGGCGTFSLKKKLNMLDYQQHCSLTLSNHCCDLKWTVMLFACVTTQHTLKYKQEMHLSNYTCMCIFSEYEVVITLPKRHAWHSPENHVYLDKSLTASDLKGSCWYELWAELHKHTVSKWISALCAVLYAAEIFDAFNVN